MNFFLFITKDFLGKQHSHCSLLSQFPYTSRSSNFRQNVTEIIILERNHSDELLVYFENFYFKDLHNELQYKEIKTRQPNVVGGEMDSVGHFHIKNWI